MAGSKRERFVHEYLIDYNAKQAAIRAGYSPKTAVKQGCRLLTYADVKHAIEIGKKKNVESLQMDRRRILEELACLASVKASDIFDFSGKKPKMKPANEIPPHAIRAIASIETNGRQCKLKLFDKHKALAMLAQHIGLLKEYREVKVEATGKDGGPIQTEVKHGFDGDLTPYLDIVKRVAGSSNLAGATPNHPQQPVPAAPPTVKS